MMMYVKRDRTMVIVVIHQQRICSISHRHFILIDIIIRYKIYISLLFIVPINYYFILQNKSTNCSSQV